MMMNSFYCTYNHAHITHQFFGFEEKKSILFNARMAMSQCLVWGCWVFMLLLTYYGETCGKSLLRHYIFLFWSSQWRDTKALERGVLSAIRKTRSEAKKLENAIDSHQSGVVALVRIWRRFWIRGKRSTLTTPQASPRPWNIFHVCGYISRGHLVPESPFIMINHQHQMTSLLILYFFTFL